jgi:hypothetical protein
MYLSHMYYKLKKKIFSEHKAQSEEAIKGRNL